MQARFFLFTAMICAAIVSHAQTNTFPSSGNVGIGTTSPQQRLHVEGTSNQAIFVSTSALGTGSGSGMIGYAKALPTATGQRLGYFLVGSRGGGQSGLNSAGMVGYTGGAWTSTSRPTYLSFETTAFATTTRAERMRIAANGYVGIGTTVPYYSLDVRSASSPSVINATNSFSGSEDRVGVNGKSVNNTGYGIGVQGTGGYIGVSGTAYTYGLAGVYAYGNGGDVIGMYALSDQYYGIYATTGNSASYAGYFKGNVYTTGSYLPSAGKLKQNIQEVNSALTLLNQLRPKEYEYRQEGTYGQMNLPKGKRYGLIAEELEEVLPGLVKETEFNSAKTGDVTAQQRRVKGETISFKAVNYTELIPIMVKGMQEQDAENKQLKEELSAVKDRLSKLEALLTKGSSTSVSVSSVYLEQSSPNPARGTALIRYGVPDGTASAKLVLTNAKGQVVKEVSLTSRGTGQVNLNTQALPVGTYTYSLYVDERQTASKQLVVIK